MSRPHPRLRAVSIALTIALLAGGLACAEGGVAGGVAGGDAGGDSGRPRSAASGDSARGPAAAAGDSSLRGPSTEEERRAIAAAAGPLPKRARKDSVALASMTRADTSLDKLWPVKMPPPRPGSILPSKRIIAYYGNPLSKRMGALGEYPKEEMLARLDREAANWAKADPSHPVVPALHMIVTVAQGDPGKAGLYRLHMRDSLVSEVHSWIRAKKGIFFVDVQVGLSNLQAELPRLRPILENPDVHLGIDPEFAMAPSGKKPGAKIGTYDAKDINWAINFLDEIVRAKNLPPKILVVHRFTRPMVTNYKDIKFTPNVQVVMHMDGWGPPWLKFDSYRDYVKKEPVQFTGFKIFYGNDAKKGDPILTPTEVLRLNPKPLYIQYQ